MKDSPCVTGVPALVTREPAKVIFDMLFPLEPLDTIYPILTSLGSSNFFAMMPSPNRSS